VLAHKALSLDVTWKPEMVMARVQSHVHSFSFVLVWWCFDTFVWWFLLAFVE
jgi:hypothetical protein